tara:strand:+ start:2206 stop:2994 length:789 start_codon:yes stop_codon:yes gene_type:complete
VSSELTQDLVKIPSPEGLNEIQTVASDWDAFNPLIDFLNVGGPVVWILMVFSVVALTISILKLTQFFLAKAEHNSDIEISLRAWKQGEIDKATNALNLQAPISNIVLSAQQACCDVYRNSDAEADVQNKAIDSYKEELSRQANALMQSLRSYLRPLEMIAALSPLLGLLGTVLGMIEAFKQMELAGSQVDPSILSGGIWQALLTTAVGLAVAIPVVMLHGYLERKCERIAFLLNDAVTRVFTQMPEFLNKNEENTHEFVHAA